MPELPEVETIVRELRELVTGETIEKVGVRLNKIVRTGPRNLGNLLKGASIEDIQRRGKFIVFILSGNRYLVVHLRMTGQFLWGQDPDAWPDHIHVKILFRSGRVLLYRDMRQFGRFWGLTGEAFRDWLDREKLGPDPLEISSEELCRLLSTRRGRIKALLLNQQFLSGLGNIYTDEALYAAGIHPLCPADHLSPGQGERLHECICSILREAIRLRGSTVRDYVGLSGVGGGYQGRHQVYGKTGDCCPKCGRPIERIVAAGRGTHFCPVCQPKPGA